MWSFEIDTVTCKIRINAYNLPTNYQNDSLFFVNKQTNPLHHGSWFMLQFTNFKKQRILPRERISVSRTILIKGYGLLPRTALINWPIIGSPCVFCESGTGSINIVNMNFRLRIKICNVHGDRVSEFHLKVIKNRNRIFSEI